MKRKDQPNRGRGKAGLETIRGTQNAEKLRVRAAWMYYVEQMTQSQIADVLNVGRVTVVRLLADARTRNEVHISISGKIGEIIELERKLETAFDIDQAIVAPVSAEDADPVPSIAAATGELISDVVNAGMCIGVGWGRTLHNSLPYIRGGTLPDLRVISLLGGIIQARRFNPAEFAWQFAEIFQGQGFLIPAPALVNSPQTRDALINQCGLDHIFQMAEDLDAVVLSVGGITETTTSYRVGYLAEAERKSLIEAGAVGDLLFHYFDEAGRIVDHELNRRIMSVSIDLVRQAPLRILTSGGREKVAALRGAIELVQPNILVTDEHTATAVLARAG